MSGPISIVLASTSPIRQAILRGADIPFKVRTGHVDESAIKNKYRQEGRTANEIALALAMAKAAAIERLDNEVVIGADQVLVMDDTVFDKPKSGDELRERLLTMRGRSHQLVGAQAVISDAQTPWIHISISTLGVRAFTDDWLDSYLKSEGEDVLYCVGGYKFEGRGAQLFDYVEGDYYAILGLELLPLMAHLRDIGALQV